MAKIMLDTNICIYILNNKPRDIKSHFDKYELGEITISAISVAELFFGVEKSRFKESNTLALHAFLAHLQVLEFGSKEAGAYAKIRKDLERRKALIGAMDMLIASTAMANDLTLITNDSKDFKRVVGLRLENWA